MPIVWKGAGRPDGRDVQQARRREEKDLDGRIMDDLAQLGFKVTRFQQARASQITPGVPDLLALHVGWKLAIWIELKSRGKKPSLAQQQWHATARAAGQHVITVWSADDLVAGLRACGAPIQR